MHRALHNHAPQTRQRDRLIALALATGVLIALLVTEPQIGLTWDEPAYIAASESYVAWFGKLLTDPRYALSPEGIQYHWEPNYEHPPLDKVWSGIVWSMTRPVLDDLAAHRLGNMILVAVLVAWLYLLLAGRAKGSASSIAGLAAVTALLTMPRFFFHAHLAALDVPAAFVVFGVTFLYWRTADRPGIGWDVALGAVWGLAMATKINAIFVPISLGLWMLIFERRTYLFRRLVVMGLLGVPLSLAVWPWLYYETYARLKSYILFVTVDHWEIGQYYLGRFYMPPPWHFAFVMTLVVVPLTLTAMYLTGIARCAVRRADRALGGLFLISALADGSPRARSKHGIRQRTTVHAHLSVPCSARRPGL